MRDSPSTTTVSPGLDAGASAAARATESTESAAPPRAAGPAPPDLDFRRAGRRRRRQGHVYRGPAYRAHGCEIEPMTMGCPARNPVTLATLTFVAPAAAGAASVVVEAAVPTCVAVTVCPPIREPHARRDGQMVATLMFVAPAAAAS